MNQVNIHKSNYTVVANDCLREKELSLKAIGLLCKMLSLPPEWDYSIKGLCKICKENETAISTALKELQEFKYVIVTKLYSNETKSGHIEYKYDIYDTPQSNSNNQNSSLEPEPTPQDLENLDPENLGLENQGQLNKDKLNKEKLSKEEYIYSLERNAQDEIKEEMDNKKTEESNVIEDNNSSIKTSNKDSSYKQPKEQTIEEVIDYLNKVVGSNYKYTSKKTRTLILARLQENFTLEDFKKVIDNKYADWKNTEYSKYLRPTTLFSNNFESYLNQVDDSSTSFQELNQIFSLYVADKGYSQELIHYISLFLKYKKENNEKVTETILNTMLSTINDNVFKYGEIPVIDAIKETITNGYKGISFDSLKRNNKVFIN